MRPKRTPTTPCWIWNRGLDGAGYGAVWVEGCVMGAHRFVYESLIEPIADGLELDHLCFNRACVNPDHLEPVLTIVNNRRRRYVRLSSEAAEYIREAYASGVPMRQLALKYDVSTETIRLAINGVTWRPTN